MSKKNGDAGTSPNHVPSRVQWMATTIACENPTSAGAPPSISFFPSGMLTHAGGTVRQSKRPAGSIGGIRGKCSGFSSASRRRMRRYMLLHRVPDAWWVASLTMTVPGPVATREEYATLWHRFQGKVRRRGGCMIWRREEQTRKADHWHVILCFEAKRITELADWRLLWLRTLPVLGECVHHVKGKRYRRTRDKLPGAVRYSCQGTMQEHGQADGAWMRYMQDHATKTKPGQVASEGRHWGVVNREAFRLQHPTYEVSFASGREYTAVMRRVRMMMRPRRKCELAPFGTKLGYRPGRGYRGASVWFMEQGKSDAVKRLIAWHRDFVPQSDVRGSP